MAAPRYRIISAIGNRVTVVTLFFNEHQRHRILDACRASSRRRTSPGLAGGQEKLHGPQRVDQELHS